MKQKLIILIIIICSCLNIIGCAKNENYKYGIGKDTIVVVGDGRFQILKGVESFSLYDLKKDKVLLDNVDEYYNDGKSRLYVFNNEMYVIIQYSDDLYSEYSERELSKEDYKIFKSDRMVKLIRSVPTKPNEIEYRTD